MNHFKMHIKEIYPGMMYFLTYADNYAVRFFKKQGFSEEITIDRSIWAGYIKDYEGATILQCTLLPKVDYTRVKDLLTSQREVSQNIFSPHCCNGYSGNTSSHIHELEFACCTLRTVLY